MLRAALLLTLSAGAYTAMATPICTDDAAQIVNTEGGPEDIVRLGMGNDVSRLIVRERRRIGYVDVKSGKAAASETLEWWKPEQDTVDLRGMSLVPGSSPGSGTLYVLDKAKGVRVWRVTIEDGTAKDAKPGERRDELKDANDLHAVGDTLYVTRFDKLGWIRKGQDWDGVVRVGPGDTIERMAPGVRGANGIVEGKDKTLVVSNYWEKRLRIVEMGNGTKTPGYGTAELDISPDNLTRDGSKIFIAGQRDRTRAITNMSLPFVSSPSAVYMIDVDNLKDGAKPILVWESGPGGRSESVAVPLPGALAIGRIRTRGLLIVPCTLPPSTKTPQP
jgi:hypothetical protein